MRHKILENKTPEEIEASVKRIPNKHAAMKRLDLINKGLDSVYVQNDLKTLRSLFLDMQHALTSQKWLKSDSYSMADTALIAYIDRIDRLGFSQLWEQSPDITRWLEQSKARPIYNEAIAPYISEDAKQTMRSNGAKAWPELKNQWATCVSEQN